MSVDIEIYLSNLVKFFGENPADLLNLIPLDKKEEFFVKVREIAVYNYEKGDEVMLTQKQFVEICLDLNGKQIKPEEDKFNTFVETIYGGYSLN
jgi:hypothetical protein